MAHRLQVAVPSLWLCLHLLRSGRISEQQLFIIAVVAMATAIGFMARAYRDTQNATITFMKELVKQAGDERAEWRITEEREIAILTELVTVCRNLNGKKDHERNRRE